MCGYERGGGRTVNYFWGNLRGRVALDFPLVHCPLNSEIQDQNQPKYMAQRLIHLQKNTKMLESQHIAQIMELLINHRCHGRTKSIIKTSH